MSHYCITIHIKQDILPQSENICLTPDFCCVYLGSAQQELKLLELPVNLCDGSLRNAKRRTPMKRIFLLSLAVALSPLMLLAQRTTATISGTITDPSGAMVPGAKVIATNTATQAATSAEANAGGFYAAPNLQPGPYRLDVTVAGFQSFEQTGIVLQVGQELAVNVSLQLGIPRPPGGDHREPEPAGRTFEGRKTARVVQHRSLREPPGWQSRRFRTEYPSRAGVLQLGLLAHQVVPHSPRAIQRNAEDRLPGGILQHLQSP